MELTKWQQQRNKDIPCDTTIFTIFNWFKNQEIILSNINNISIIN